MPLVWIIFTWSRVIAPCSKSSTCRLSVDASPLQTGDGSALRVRSLPSCGLGHCLALGLAGEVFSWATSREGHRFGQLGHAEDKTGALYKPRRIELPDGAAASTVSAGAMHSAVVDEHKRLWVFGSDRWTQLGQNVLWKKGAVWQRTPVQVGGELAAERVVDAACGRDHTLALTEGGQVWAFGTGQDGQLFGAADKQFTAAPRVSRPLTGPHGAAKVAATEHCSCALATAAGAGKLTCIGTCPDKARAWLLSQLGS